MKKEIIINYVQSLTEHPLNKVSQYHEVTDYRHLLIYLLKRYQPTMGYREIVKSFNYTEYSLCCYVLKKFEGQLKVDPKFKKYIDGHIEKVDRLIRSEI